MESFYHRQVTWIASTIRKETNYYKLETCTIIPLQRYDCPAKHLQTATPAQ
jgi:hypothetical protein